MLDAQQILDALKSDNALRFEVLTALNGEGWDEIVGPWHDFKPRKPDPNDTYPAVPRAYRYGANRKAVARVHQVGNTFEWFVGVERGKTATLDEAKAAADAVLKQEGWTMVG